MALADPVDGAPVGARDGGELSSAVPVEYVHDESVKRVVVGIVVFVEDVTEVGDEPVLDVVEVVGFFSDESC